MKLFSIRCIAVDSWRSQNRVSRTINATKPAVHGPYRRCLSPHCHQTPDFFLVPPCHPLFLPSPSSPPPRRVSVCGACPSLQRLSTIAVILRRSQSTRWGRAADFPALHLECQTVRPSGSREFYFSASEKPSGGIAYLGIKPPPPYFL
ncbi:hypothetical protein AB1N83_008809 [Pleurotus pulmonarius]